MMKYRESVRMEKIHKQKFVRFDVFPLKNFEDKNFLFPENLYSIFFFFLKNTKTNLLNAFFFIILIKFLF